MKKQRPLITRLRSARILLQTWERALRDGNRDTMDAPLLRELDAFKEAQSAINEAVRAMTLWQHP